MTENYVNLNLSRIQRSVLVQLRCGILPLNIETGRFIGIAEENRICDVCNSGCIENEYHFIFYCDAYREERAEFTDTVKLNYPNFTNTPDNVKLKTLFTFEPRMFSKFVCKILDKRCNLLYETV